MGTWEAARGVKYSYFEQLLKKKIIYSLFKKSSKIAERKSSDIKRYPMVSLNRKSFNWTTLCHYKQKYKHLPSVSWI